MVLIGPVAAPDLHVMTLNVRRRLRGTNVRSADRWENRAPHLRALLNAEQPAVVGVQEALPDQAAFVRASLGGRYRFVGVGRRADGRGEGCPLFYDTDRLELIEGEQWALSDTPDQAGSTSWGNVIPRIAVSAHLRDRVTSRSFLAVNTHFDHVSRTSRLRAARAIRRHVAARGLPAVLTGDLNTTPGTAPMIELFSGTTLVDALPAPATRSLREWGTFPNYREPRRGGKRIDWIAVSPSITVVEAAVNTRRYDGGWASDHLPVQAVLRLPESSARE